VNGVTVEPGADACAYVQALLPVLRDPSRYQALVEGTRIVAEDFSWERWGAAMRELVREMVAERAAP
jgi:glycosyltransferase involved in cell wall biosynthesis